VAQAWKMYVSTEPDLPHAQRMEALNQRMTALAVKRKEAETAATNGREVEGSTEYGDDIGEFRALSQLGENGRAVTIEQVLAQVDYSANVRSLPLGTSSSRNGLASVMEEPTLPTESETRGRRAGKALTKVVGFGVMGDSPENDDQDDLT